MNQRIKVLGNLSNRMRLGMLKEEKAREIWKEKIEEKKK